MAGRNKVILFGGNDASNDLSETWSWDGNNWILLHPSASPSARRSTSMAYNSSSGQIVLFGGIQTISGTLMYLGDTWVWDGTTWSKKSPRKSPSPRFGAAMTFDAAHNLIVLFGGVAPDTRGSGYHSLNDTWTWDGTTWTLKTPTSSPSVRARARLVYDPVRGNSTFFSGVDSHPSPPPYNQPADTWSWDGSNWTPRSPIASPPARYDYGAAFDSLSSIQRTVIFGGQSYDNSSGVYTDHSDTWDWDGSNWSQEDLLTAPSARDGFSLVYVSNGGYILMFGGKPADYTAPYLNETWVLND